MGAENVEVRPFMQAEWHLYKAIRLKALLSDPKVFGSSYALEADAPDEKWKNALDSPEMGVFAIIHYGDIIGMTGIALSKENKTTAKLWGSWLEPKWRGKGLSEKMYAARIDWAIAHPIVKRIVVSHRESNEASRRANQRHGFVFTHKQDHIWRDGVSEPELFYELALPK